MLADASACAPTAPAARSPQDSDHELMQRAQLGAVEAFAAIYDRHASAVLALGARMLTSASDAQDLLQDVFLEAWQSVREYDAGRGSVRAWLMVRMRSRALDRLSRRARDGVLHQALTALRSGAGVAHIQDERSLAMRQAFEQLDQDTRDSLSLMYFWGLTAPEISAQMKVAEGTVRSRIARGLGILERVLGEAAQGEGEA